MGQPGKELEILLGIFALFVVVLLAARNRERRHPENTVFVRAGTALTTAAIATGAGFWLHHLATSPDTYALAYVLTAG